MEEEIKTTEEEINYIEEIQKLKENTVDKTKYDKVVDENKKLVKALVEGGQIDNGQAPEPVNIEAIRKELFTEDCELNNLEYCTKALQLRDALIEKGEPDPFLPIGSHVALEESDIATANRVADTIKECIEYADGDNSVFTAKLNSVMVDPIIKRRK